MFKCHHIAKEKKKNKQKTYTLTIIDSNIPIP